MTGTQTLVAFLGILLVILATVENWKPELKAIGI